MIQPKLLSADEPKVQSASRKAVQLYFTRYAKSGINDRWIGPRNRYRKTAIQTYEHDARSSSIRHAALIDYISASAPTHLIDGWSYLGRATAAILRGDLNSAIHSAYYAELRAAMSLLASEGIGVFSSRHPVIEPAGTTTSSITHVNVWNKTEKKYKSKPASTHRAIWPLLNYWSSLKRASTLIEGFIAPDGYSLKQWLVACGISSSTKAISKKWLKSWGTDLTRLTDDRESRNMVSYRPSELRLAPAPTALLAIDFVFDLWSLFEPTSGGRFPRLERELLKRVIRQQKVIVQANSLAENLGLTQSAAKNWAKYFNDHAGSQPLHFADKRSDVDKTDCAFEVTSRAALLLFLASNSTRKHLIDAGYSASQLNFFWRRLCEVRFDGPASSFPDEPLDFWGDIEANVAEARKWRENAASTTSLGEWRRSQPEVMNQLVCLELAGVWGLVS